MDASVQLNASKGFGHQCTFLSRFAPRVHTSYTSDFDYLQTAIYGNFSAPKVQEVVVSRGKILELLRPDDQGTVQVIHSTQVFGEIRSLAPFRFPGGQQDYVIAGSDSGRLVILQFSKEKNCFVKIHQETYGKSGSRRIVPGQYLAVDPKGRACLVGALEKQKFVYVLNRDNEARLTISSPLEAHKSHHITYDVVGLDVGFDNPQFAAIELDYADADTDPTGEAATVAEKMLVIYELDLGLNTVTRKHSTPIDFGSNLLISLPGPADGGPGGVLVCAENAVLYFSTSSPENNPLRVAIPRRKDLAEDRSVLITATAVLRQKNRFFTFVQSEYGDLYRVTLVYEGEAVQEVKMKYFDTIPTASALCIFRRGFLFAGSEFGNHALYQFQGLGDDDAVETSSSLVKSEGVVDGTKFESFDPRETLVNLELIDSMESLAPIVDMKIANLLSEETPQIYAACGRGSLSTLRVLRPGLAVTEMAVSPLPAAAIGVWTLKKSLRDEHDAFIVVAFASSTLILKIGETVEQVENSGFSTDTTTLIMQTMADDSMVQVTPQGIRHVRGDGRVNEWKSPNTSIQGKNSISKATANERQIIIALAGGEILYFELSAQGGGMLLETEKRDLGSDISCMDVGPVLQGRLRSKFLAVGGYDNTVRVLSLEPGEGLKALALQAVASTPEGVLFLPGPSAFSESSEGLFLQIGLSNGVLLRTQVDSVTGQLTDARTRFLGVKGPRLFGITVRGTRAMLALSTRPWLGHFCAWDKGRYEQVPISYEGLDYAAPFASEQCSEGFVAVTKSTLRVLTIERLGEFFNQQVVKLRHTPRRLAIHPDYNLLLVAEADAQARTVQKSASDDSEQSVMVKTAPPGAWASCLTVIDPSTLTSTVCIELDGDEAAISLAVVHFQGESQGGGLICVGTVKGLKFHPRQDQGGFVRVYRLNPTGTALELLHVTPVGGVPRAMAAYKDRLLVGAGSTLKLYELGKKRLLRKCEYRGLPCEIATLHTQGPRIYVGDAQDSFFFMKYKKQENAFYIFADDSVPRHMTAATFLDYDTVAGGDRFGNAFVLRLPPEVSAAVEEDPTAGKYAGGEGGVGGRLGSAAHRLQTIASFHVGETIMAMQRAEMQPGGREALFYATLNGTIGALFPFSSKEDVHFFQNLEMHLRQESPPLLGRDHMAYRSAYAPVKDVVDGDLCAGGFGRLSVEKQRSIALDLDRSGPGEVIKKLEDMQNRII